MATSFLSLPPEIRNLIYQHLLEKPCDIFLNHANRKAPYEKPSGKANLCESDTTRPAQLISFWNLGDDHPKHSGIVQACRQINQEATDFLFTGKVFHYAFMDISDDFRRRFKGREFSAHALPNIQHLKVHVDENYGHNISSDKVADVVDYFRRKIVALKHFDLLFEFISCVALDPQKRYRRWMRNLANSELLVDSVRALDGLQVIDIVVADEEEKAGDFFKPFVQGITNTGKWLCDNDDGEYRFDEEEYETCHRWTWHLRPASKLNSRTSEKSSLLGNDIQSQTSGRKLLIF